MSSAYTIILQSPAMRAKATEAVRRAPDGYVFTIEPPSEKPRTNPQNKRFHAMIRDVARQVRVYHGVNMDETTWKDVFLDALFRGETKLVPSLDGSGLVPLKPHFSALNVKQAIDGITIVQAFGDQNGVTFKADQILEDSYGR